MIEYKVAHIEKATLNGRKVKIFHVYVRGEASVWESSAWMHFGVYSLPARISNKHLLPEWANNESMKIR